MTIPGPDWLNVEWLNEHTELWCTCSRCNCHTGAFSKDPQILQAVLDRFLKHHERCKERVAQ